MRVLSALAGTVAAVAIAAPPASARPARLAVAGGGSIYTMAADGSARERLTYGTPFEGPIADYGPRWLPGGRGIAWQRYRVSHPFGADESIHPQVWAMNADGTGRHRVPLGGGTRTTDYLAAVTPGGRIVITRLTATRVWSIVVDAGGRHVDRLPESARGPFAYWEADYSPDGKSVVYEGGSYLWIARPDGSDERLLDADASHGRWSPDGQRITYVSTHDRNGATCYESCDVHGEIYVIDADGSHRRRLTYSKADDRNPDWSADGTRIAFASNRNYPTTESSEIYSVRPDGSCLTWLTNGALSMEDPDWSPAGGSADAHACGPAGRPVRLDADTRRLSRRKNFPLYWFGPHLPNGVFFSGVGVYSSLAQFQYWDCGFWTPARCGRSTGVTSTSACRVAWLPLYHGRARNYSRRRGALLVTTGLQRDDPTMFTGATYLYLPDVTPSVGRLRPYPRTKPVDRLPAPAFPDWFWRNLREVKDSYARTHDTAATASELGLRESAVKRRLAVARRLRKLHVHDVLAGCPEPPGLR